MKEAPAWIDKMLYVLNRFMEETYGAFNKDITFNENIACGLRDITFTTKSTYAAPDNEFDMQRISNPLRVNPTGVLLMRAQNLTNNQPIKSALGIDWDIVDNNIRILHVSGLEASTKYKLSLLII